MRISRYLSWALDQPGRGEKKDRIIEERPRNAKLWGYDLFFLTALACLMFFFGADRLALLGPDEPRYAEIARAMYATGDYVSPRLGGCLWFEKPALYYWLGAVSYRLFGVNEFAARFPSGLAAMTAMLFMYVVLARAVSKRWAMLSCVVLATSGIIIAYSHAATPDMLLTAAMAVAILAGYRATQSAGRAELLFAVLSFAATGLSFLAKGLVGIALVFAILFFYLLIAGRLRFIRPRYLLIGVGIFLTVSALWYLPVTLRHGWEFIDQFFVRHHFQRYVQDVYGHPQPIYFFPAIAVLGVLPWSFFLLPAVAQLRRLKPRTNERDSLLALAWVWLLVPLVFFSLSESKLPGYLLPAFPALAIIVGAEVESFIKGEQRQFIKLAGGLLAILLVLVALAFCWYLKTNGVSWTGWYLPFCVAPLLLSCIGVLALVRKRREGLILCAVAVVVGVVVGGALLLFPAMNERISLKRLSLEAAAALRPGEKIGYYILKEYAAVFYAEGRVVCGTGEGDVLNALREDKLVAPLELYPSLIFITRERWVEGLMKDARFEKEFIAQQGDYYAFRVRLKQQANGN